VYGETAARSHGRRGILGTDIVKKEFEMQRFLITLVFVPVLGLSAAAQSSPQGFSGQGSTIVEINGVRLTLADVERKRPSLFQARTAF